MRRSSVALTGVIDARLSGVSGDKYLGALVDIGASATRLKKVGRVVAELLPGTREVDVEVRGVERGEIGAKLVSVRSKEELSERKGNMLRSSTHECARRLELSDWSTKFVMSTMDTLLRAESQIHGRDLQEVELHELGSADTLVDILGVAYSMEELGLSGVEWWSTPVAVGAGTSHFSGRAYPNPPPAVAEILRHHEFPMEGRNVNQELSTPTGVAITVNLARKASEVYPAMRPYKIGYGAGSNELDGVTNVLRLMVGERLGGLHSHDQVVILETNLDDVSGEVIGHAIEKLMSAGARDVTVAPVFMKKNRPGHIVSVIADEDKAERLVAMLIEETGTLGVREIPVRRHIALRTDHRLVMEVAGKKYPVRVKMALDEKGRVTTEKVEYEDLRRIAKDTGLSLREILEVAKTETSKRH